jgi:methionine sulfoxide reductase heme-binding subunit
LTIAWYAARAGGIVAFALLTAGVVFGLTLSGRARLEGWPRFAVEDVHRFVGLLAGTFVGIHVAGLLAETYVPFSLTQILVPGTAPYRPLATALGVIAMELLAALAVTNHYRKRIPHGVWRRAHYLNFAVWLLALVHGIAAGTDSAAWWGVALYSASAASVAALLVWRALGSARVAGADRQPLRRGLRPVLEDDQPAVHPRAADDRVRPALGSR